MEGSGELHAKAGSNVTLSCILTNCLVRPTFAFWSVLIIFGFILIMAIPLKMKLTLLFLSRYHINSRLMTSSGSRFTEEVVMEREKKAAILQLTISRLKQEDEGNYTCIPDTGGQLSQVLHVLAGKIPLKALRSGDTVFRWKRKKTIKDFHICVILN